MIKAANDDVNYPICHIFYLSLCNSHFDVILMYSFQEFHKKNILTFGKLGRNNTIT